SGARRRRSDWPGSAGGSWWPQRRIRARAGWDSRRGAPHFSMDTAGRLPGNSASRFSTWWRPGSPTAWFAPDRPTFGARSGSRWSALRPSEVAPRDGEPRLPRAGRRSKQRGRLLRREVRQLARTLQLLRPSEGARHPPSQRAHDELVSHAIGDRVATPAKRLGPG